MAVLWKQLLVFAPQIIDLSRELLKRARGTSPKSAALVQAPDSTDLPQRVTALEENERRQAELVDQMARQVAELSEAAVVLHRRQRQLIAAVVLLGGVLLWKVFRG
jgi:hypothetical protein